MKFLFLVFVMLFSYSPKLDAQPTISFSPLHSGFDAPVDIAAPNDSTNRLFVVEKDGYIQIIENGIKLNTPFLDIDAQVLSNGERGLLGLAFHPEYASNGYFFTNYINNNGDTVIARWKVSSGNQNIADINSKKILLTIDQPRSNHNAGDLNFSPIDSFLYIPMGDGGSGGDPWCNSQDSTEMLGKILRIDVKQNENTSPYYGIPADNPYLSYAHVPDEIWAFGMRNPWRSSFDRKTGDMWIADVGQGSREEIDYIAANTPGGMNFGWKIMEGSLCYTLDPEEVITPCLESVPLCNDNAYTEPIFEYGRSSSNGGSSVTGGFVYRGCDYPGMYGYYIFTDFNSKNSWFLTSDGTATLFTGAPLNITTYGEDKNGELYAADIGGSIYKIEDSSIASSLTLTSSDYPLDGTYEALDSIEVLDPLNLGSNNVIFKTPKLILPESIELSSTGMIKMAKNDCLD